MIQLALEPTLLDSQIHARLNRLRLVTLYLTERCNSRCVTCDYWRYGRATMTLESVQGLLPSLVGLRTEAVLISGGEPLLNPEWQAIATALRSAGLKLWLLTSGLSLAKHARRVAQLFDAVTVSLDGTTRETYLAIRGVNAFAQVCSGIRACANAGVKPAIRVTLQRANYRELPAFIDLAHRVDAHQISFLPVDIANPHAFARDQGFDPELALGVEDLPILKQLLAQIEKDHACDFESGYIAERPQKLRRMLSYFSALHGLNGYPAVHCNAPEFSAVIDAAMRLRPCFFIPGPNDAKADSDLAETLNSAAMQQLRATIQGGLRPECTACVCQIWRSPGSAQPLIAPARQLVAS